MDVNYGAALKALDSGDPAPIYVLHGGDGYLQAELVSRLREILVPAGMEEFGYQVFDGAEASMGEILGSCRTPGFFGGRLIVIHDHPVFGGDGGEAEEALMEYAEEPSHGSCLVFRLARSPDRRRKLVKALARYMVDCESLKGPELDRWLRDLFRARGHAVEPGALAHLGSLVGGLMPVLAREADKVMAYAGSGQTVTREHVDAVAVGMPQETVFRLLDAVCTGKADDAVMALGQLRDRGEAVPMILYMLARQLRLIRLAREMAGEGKPPATMARELGQHPFVMKKCAAQARRFTRWQLIKGLELVLQADYRVKSGRIDEDLAVERLIADLVQLSSPA